MPTRRIAAAAGSLVIREDRLRALIAAYETFRDTLDFAIEALPPLGQPFQTLSEKSRDTYLNRPAYRRLVELIAHLSYDERIDLMALGWLGRESGSWRSWLEHAYQLGINDTHYEAALGGYWQKGINRWREAQQA